MLKVQRDHRQFKRPGRLSNCVLSSRGSKSSRKLRKTIKRTRSATKALHTANEKDHLNYEAVVDSRLTMVSQRCRNIPYATMRLSGVSIQG